MISKEIFLEFREKYSTTDTIYFTDFIKLFEEIDFKLFIENILKYEIDIGYNLWNSSKSSTYVLDMFDWRSSFCIKKKLENEEKRKFWLDLEYIWFYLIDDFSGKTQFSKLPFEKIKLLNNQNSQKIKIKFEGE
jgi:hypothetical protein